MVRWPAHSFTLNGNDVVLSVHCAMVLHCGAQPRASRNVVRSPSRSADYRELDPSSGILREPSRTGFE